MIFTTSDLYAEHHLEYRFVQFTNPFVDSPFRENNIEDGLRVLVTIGGVNGNCNTTLIISVAYQTQSQVLCEDARGPLEDPIASEEFEFVFPKGDIEIGKPIDVCVRAEMGFSDCKTLDVKSEQQLEKVSFNLP